MIGIDWLILVSAYISVWLVVFFVGIKISDATMLYILYPLCVILFERLLWLCFSLLPRPNVYYTKQTLRDAILGEQRTCWLLLGWLTTAGAALLCFWSAEYFSARLWLANVGRDYRQRTNGNKPNRQIERKWLRGVAPKGPHFIAGIKPHSALSAGRVLTGVSMRVLSIEVV